VGDVHRNILYLTFQKKRKKPPARLQVNPTILLIGTCDEIYGRGSRALAVSCCELIQSPLWQFDRPILEESMGRCPTQSFEYLMVN
jgi:hypothetical protein